MSWDGPVGRGPGAVDVLGRVGVRAHLAERVIDDIAGDPHDGRLAQLAGSRVGPGFRATVGKLLPDEVAAAGRLHLLLDDWVGAALVSGYAVQHAAITLGIEERLPAGTAEHMAGICAGFAEDASLVPYAKRNGTIPSVHGPEAPPPDPDGMHSVAADPGMTLSEMRDRVRGEFVGISTCTHLNDKLRAVADLDALLDLRAGL